MEANEIRLCKDCKFHIPSPLRENGEFDTCKKFVRKSLIPNETLYRVRGLRPEDVPDTPFLYKFCDILREIGGECGPEGNWWETK